MIEKVNERFPKLRIISTFALIPKAVYFRDVLTFVITPWLRILYFVSEQSIGRWIQYSAYLDQRSLRGTSNSCLVETEIKTEREMKREMKWSSLPHCWIEKSQSLSSQKIKIKYYPWVNKLISEYLCQRRPMTNDQRPTVTHGRA